MTMCLVLLQGWVYMNVEHSIQILAAFRMKKEQWEVLVYKDDY